MGKRGLGRGLDALITVEYEDSGNLRQEVEIRSISRRSAQPRKHFSEEGLQELAASIREHGILQPILVRPIEEEQYEVVAGERRLRAAELAGVERVPVIIREMGEKEAAEIALIENLQREDLNPVEEAMAFRQMLEQHGYTQEQVAQRIGKSRSHVANTLRILNLPVEILGMIEKGELSAGHARAILASGRSEREKVEMARKIIGRGLSVRQAEQATRGGKNSEKANRAAEMIELEERMEHRLGTRTKLIKKKRGGKIEIFFYDDEDLERILDILEI